MVNKSMMHTHASGCHKRRSLPAHSLAAAGLSLLLAFSCPFAVRADTNLSAEEAIDSFYEKNVPNNIGNSNNFDDYTWIKNVPLNRTNEATYGLQVFDSINSRTETGVDEPSELPEYGDTIINIGLGDDKKLKEKVDGGYNITISQGAILEVQSGSVNILTLKGSGDFIVDLEDNYTTFAMTDPSINLNKFEGNIIVKNGEFQVSAEISKINGFTILGGNRVYVENNNLNLDNKNITLDIRNNRLFSNRYYINYEGKLQAAGANIEVYVGKNYNTNCHILEVNGTAVFSNTSVNVKLDDSIDTSKGYTVALMHINGTGVTADNFISKKNSIKIGSTIIQGTGFDQVFRVDTQSTGTTAVYLDLLPSENGTIDGAKGISEGYLSGLMLTLQGADLVATRGMQAAMAATKEVEDVTFTPWATVSGSSVRYNTGAHADLNSFNMLTGIALGKGFDAGRVTVGAFFEYGTGSYKTSNSFDGHGSYDGKGDSYYLGWGLLARMDFADTGPGHFYVEGSGRMGGLYNNYSNEDLRDGFGREAEYDSYAPYYSFHAGLGYIWDINEQASLEFYGKYLWTRECGDSVTLSTGEEVDFEDIDSSRLRFGTRLDYRVNEYITPYIGVAWEHEFDGESSATTNNLPILEPDLRGDTGIGEIGLTITPSETIPLTVDLGVTGYVGTREGISGSLLVKWTF